MTPQHTSQRDRAALALAKGVWKASQKNGLLFEDIIGCCAVLVASVSKNSGEPMDYLLSEIERRSRLV